MRTRLLKIALFQGILVRHWKPQEAQAMVLGKRRDETGVVVGHHSKIVDPATDYVLNNDGMWSIC